MYPIENIILARVIMVDIRDICYCDRNTLQIGYKNENRSHPGLARGQPKGLCRQSVSQMNVVFSLLISLRVVPERILMEGQIKR